jgi:hypothetical protein
VVLFVVVMDNVIEQMCSILLEHVSVHPIIQDQIVNIHFALEFHQIILLQYALVTVLANRQMSALALRHIPVITALYQNVIMFQQITQQSAQDMVHVLLPTLAPVLQIIQVQTVASQSVMVLVQLIQVFALVMVHA